MSKRRLTHRQRLRKMLKEAEPGSVLYAELMAVHMAIEKPRNHAVTALIKLLKNSSQREPKWFIGKVFGTLKDERVVGALVRAAQAPENATHYTDFIWPLENHDCTKHLPFFVNFMVKCDDPGEAMWACTYVIRAMKGPFNPVQLRKQIRKLLAETQLPTTIRLKPQSERFKTDAAADLMTKYHIQINEAYRKQPVSDED